MKSGEWLKKTLTRLVALGAVCLILAWLLVYLPADRSKRLIKSQLQASGQAQSQLKSAKESILSVPRIDDISLRHGGFFREYSDTVSQASKKLNRLSISYLAPRRIIGLHISQRGQVLTDVNSQTKNINFKSLDAGRTDLKKSQQLMIYQVLVSRTLTNILEYDPATDTANFSLGSGDTNQRLDLAQSGLAKTLAGLQRAKSSYSDPSLNEVISQIRSLQSGRDKLAQDGDTSSWIQAVIAAQKNIVSNRKAFWESHEAPLSRDLENDIDNFAKLMVQWSQLDQKYNS